MVRDSKAIAMARAMVFEEAGTMARMIQETAKRKRRWKLAKG